MRPEIVDVIEKAKRLELRLEGDIAPRLCINLAPEQFEVRLVELCEALQRLESGGALALQIDSERIAKSVFQVTADWLKRKGIDATELTGEVLALMRAADHDTAAPKSRPRYVGVDGISADDKSVQAVSEAADKMEAILKSVRADLARLRGGLVQSAEAMGDERRFEVAARLRALEEGVAGTLEDVDDRFHRPSPDAPAEASDHQARVVSSMQDRLSMIIRGASDNPKLARIAQVWKRLLDGILVDRSVSRVMVSFEDFRALNRMVSELLDRDAAEENLEPQERPNFHP